MLFLLLVVVAVFTVVTLCVQNFQLRQQVREDYASILENLRYAAECSEKANHLMDNAPVLALVETTRAMQIVRLLFNQYGRRKVVELGNCKEGTLDAFISVVEAQRQAAFARVGNSDVSPFVKTPEGFTGGNDAGRAPEIIENANGASKASADEF